MTLFTDPRNRSEFPREEWFESLEAKAAGMDFDLDDEDEDWDESEDLSEMTELADWVPPRGAFGY